MELSYFNRNVSYKTLKVGTLDLTINNVTLEAIPLLEIFVSATESGYGSSSILNYFNKFFIDLDEESLYEYLEKAIKLIHRLEIDLDDILLYFLYLLQIPKNILVHIYLHLVDPFTYYYYTDEDSELNTHETIEDLWFYLKGDPINIEESIEYYILLIEYTYWIYEGDVLIEVKENLEEAAEIYAENGRYDLFLINYININNDRLYRSDYDDLSRYISVNRSDLNKHLPNFILHNYYIICGDVFIVHYPLLNELPTKMKDELINNKNNIYDTHLDKSRSDDMKQFLEKAYNHFVRSKRYEPNSMEITFLLIDLKLIYKYIIPMHRFGRMLYIKLSNFIKEDNVLKLRDYINNYEITYMDEKYTNKLWNIIELFRKHKYNNEARYLYELSVSRGSMD